MLVLVDQNKILVDQNKIFLLMETFFICHFYSDLEWKNKMPGKSIPVQLFLS